MSDPKPILPNDSSERAQLSVDDAAFSETKSRTVIEDTKSRSGSQPDSKPAKPEAVGVGTMLGPY